MDVAYIASTSSALCATESIRYSYQKWTQAALALPRQMVTARGTANHALLEEKAAVRCGNGL
ncbi:hypothetical protein SAMN00790413_06701 [Deinococcus hopiensis KR-140]|uniref:Uncharacterized protein n=1 Tax=Deinococcus hopiensis KR-140 TaxID=695939 RepID=A0A1W1UCJ9_9DEIO|nr:hypothetical protein SAMN00790413_06701 [Deinococcus hopiensis KR-140]